MNDNNNEIQDQSHPMQDQSISGKKRVRAFNRPATPHPSAGTARMIASLSQNDEPKEKIAKLTEAFRSISLGASGIQAPASTPKGSPIATPVPPSSPETVEAEEEAVRNKFQQSR